MLTAKYDKHVAELAIVIASFKYKDAQKLYKGKPLWHLSLPLAKYILKAKDLLSDTKIDKPFLNDDKLMAGLTEYIKRFNQGTPKSLGQYVSIEAMKDGMLNLHILSLKGAVEKIME